MSADPSEPDTFQDDDVVELPVEMPEADAAEQHTRVRLDGDDPLTHIDPDSASEADALEQARVVELDEDDYGSGS